MNVFIGTFIWMFVLLGQNIVHADTPSLFSRLKCQALFLLSELAGDAPKSSRYKNTRFAVNAKGQKVVEIDLVGVDYSSIGTGIQSFRSFVSFATNYPKVAAQFGVYVFKNIKGEVVRLQYPILIKDLNANAINGLKFVRVEGRISDVDYLRFWANGEGVIARNGEEHFHDIGVHFIGLNLLPKELVNASRAAARNMIEIYDAIERIRFFNPAKAKELETVLGIDYYLKELAKDLDVSTLYITEATSSPRDFSSKYIAQTVQRGLFNWLAAYFEQKAQSSFYQDFLAKNPAIQKIIAQYKGADWYSNEQVRAYLISIGVTNI
jgi:hypothetical protein